MLDRGRRGAGIWIVAASLIAFGLGLSALFSERLESGDVYPAYSSLRSDPLGCRALYGALDRDAEVEVGRAFARGDFRSQAPGATYLFLGIPATSFNLSETDMQDIDTLARQGHRVAASFAPQAFSHGDAAGLRDQGLLAPEPRSAKADSTGDSGKVAGKIAYPRMWHPPGKPRKAIAPKRPWGFRLRMDTTFAEGARSSALALGNIPDTVAWLSGLYFDSLSEGWYPAYTRNGLAVVIERKAGTGSMLLASDSYFASNEAQRGRPPARLAARMLGAGTRIWFDERHLGVRQDDAIADLLERHNLHWMLPSLLLLFGLFVWETRARLTPPSRRDSAMPAATDPRTAMAGLLRRNLGDRGVLSSGYALWKEAAARKRPPTAAEASEIQTILSRRPAGPYPLASAYAEIQAILNRRKRK